MGALPFQSLAFLPCAASLSPSCMKNEQPKNGMAKSLHDRYRSLVVKRLPRRLLLQFMGFNPILLCIIEGEGPEANEGDVVEVNYVCRRANGYFVHSTVDQFSGESKPITLPLDENQFGPRRSLLSHANEPLVFEVQLLKGDSGGLRGY
ncbi:peptidyl-prolyl cis-trans isomerase fkbp16-1 [Quercus suber]|uniref:Peptidyl-prolyl cis-trans isomerase fkbp16-1 n=1 Tax=Quercus suber TaxID=58331 RepID=A0AAW0LY66_QUESU